MEVDALKIAFLLRTADAAHIDSRRAPIYSYNYMSPRGVSKAHWHFQNKLGRVTLSDNQYLRISSGSSFSENERSSWWLAFDTARMINSELQDALNYLSDAGREQFTATKVLGVDSPENFSKYVKADGWEPEDISLHVSDLPRLISTLGGMALYGENNYVGIRELIQNGFDAVIAARNLGYLDDQEGVIALKLERNDDNSWRFSITDNGLGMSRYVLSNILLDFGKSLWSDDDIRYEHPRLAQTGFSSIGQFGIGFYSIFMLSNQVTVITNRYKSKLDENNTHWKLTFQNGLTERPFISRPIDQEQLKKHGTMVSFIIDDKVFLDLLSLKKGEELHDSEKVEQEFVRLIKWMLPACEIDITLDCNGAKKKVITANDWLEIPSAELLSRVNNNEKGTLYPIFYNGKIVGRLRTADFVYFNRLERAHATVTYKGAMAGDLYGLHGVCISKENNGKAERNDAVPHYPLESWRDWALSIVRNEPKLSNGHLLRLHILIPDEDLYVWFIGEERSSIGDMREFLSVHDEFYSIDGMVVYEEDDDMKNSEFDSYFILNDDVIVIPLFMGRFFRDGESNSFDHIVKSITSSSINYTNKLEDLVTSVWGDFESDDKYMVVGNVNGTDITRNVTVYKKV